MVKACLKERILDEVQFACLLVNEANWGYTLHFMDKSAVYNVLKGCLIASAHPPGFSL